MQYLSNLFEPRFLSLFFITTISLFGGRDGYVPYMRLGDLNPIVNSVVLACAKTGTVDKMERMLRLGGNIYATDDAGKNVFHYAAEGGNGAMILWLVEALKVFGSIGDLPFRADANGRTPLHYAATHDYFEGVEALTESIFHANVLDEYLLTPLFYAAWHNRVSMIAFLHERGAFINGGIEVGRLVTPLFYAVMRGHLESVEALIARGAQVRVFNNEGFSPLDIACQVRNGRIVRAILAEITRVYEGLTPLHQAVLGYAFGDDASPYTLERIKHSLRQENDMHIQDGYGLSPYQYAHMLGLMPVIELFEHYQNGLVESTQECIVLEEGTLRAMQQPRREASH